MAVVCVRILAAYLVLSNLGALTTLLSVFLVSTGLRDVVWIPLVPPVVMMILGVSALLYSRGLVARAFAGVSEPSLVMPDGERLLRIGTLLIGLFLVATALSPLVVAVIQLVALGDVTSASDLDLRLEHQKIVASVARSIGSILLGLVMMRMPHRISTMWQAGTSAELKQ
jgi:hypothetical protein